MLKIFRCPKCGNSQGMRMEGVGGGSGWIGCVELETKLKWGKIVGEGMVYGNCSYRIRSENAIFMYARVRSTIHTTSCKWCCIVCICDVCVCLLWRIIYHSKSRECGNKKSARNICSCIFPKSVRANTKMEKLKWTKNASQCLTIS